MSALDALNDIDEDAGQSMDDGVRRDRWKRYLIVPPYAEGEPIPKAVGYIRATTVAKCLDDTSNLTDWTARMVLIGIGRRESLYARALTIEPNDRKALNALAGDCKTEGGGDERRDTGTAMHKLVERKALDPEYEVPSLFRDDVDAILKAIDDAGFEIAGRYSEVVVVIDRLTISGTADLILRHKATGRLFIGDLKTGASVEYGSLSWAVQMATYANGDNVYVQGKAADGSQDVRQVMPDVDKASAIIIHCEPHSGRADLYRSDITRGTEYLALAYQVYLARKEKGLLTLISDAFTVEDMLAIEATATEQDMRDAEESAMVASAEQSSSFRPVADPGNTDPLAAERQVEYEEEFRAAHGHYPDEDAALDPQVISWLLDSIDAVKAFGPDALATMAEHWPEGVSKAGAVRKGTAMWDREDCRLVEECLTMKVGKRHEIPWPARDPRMEGKSTEKVAAVGIVTAKPEDVAALRAKLKGMSEVDKGRVRSWSEKAKRHASPWSMGRSNEGVQSLSYLRSLAAATLADGWADGTDEGLNALNAGLGLTDSAEQFEENVGIVLAGLDADQCARIVAFLNFGPSFSMDADGAMIFEG